MQVKQLSTGEKVFRVISTLILLLIIFVMLYPFWYVIVCSFSSLSHVQNTTFILWPDGLHLEAYQQVFRHAKSNINRKRKYNYIVICYCSRIILLIVNHGHCKNRSSNRYHSKNC